MREPAPGEPMDRGGVRAPDTEDATGGTVFEYTVEPDTVECSNGREFPGPARMSTATLTVHAANRAGVAVACPLVSVGMALGSGEGALTADPSTVRSAPGRTTPWHVEHAGGGRWDCVPLPPTTGLGPAQRAAFELSGIVVNESPGITRLRVEETTGGIRRSVDLPVMKTPAPPVRPDLPGGP